MRYIAFWLVITLLGQTAFSAEPKKGEFQVVFVRPETLRVRLDNGTDDGQNVAPLARFTLSYNTVHRFIVSLGEARDVIKCKLLVESGNPRVEEYLEHFSLSVGFIFEDLQRVDEGKAVFKIYRFDEDLVHGIRDGRYHSSGVLAFRTTDEKTMVDMIAEKGTRNIVMYMELLPGPQKSELKVKPMTDSDR